MSQKTSLICNTKFDNLNIMKFPFHVIYFIIIKDRIK